MEQIAVQRLTRNVRSIRLLLCLSQQEAAERLGRDLSLWQALESPDLQLSALTVATLVKVACVLRVGLSDLKREQRLRSRARQIGLVLDGFKAAPSGKHLELLSELIRELETDLGVVPAGTPMPWDRDLAVVRLQVQALIGPVGAWWIAIEQIRRPGLRLGELIGALEALAAAPPLKSRPPLDAITSEQPPAEEDQSETAVMTPLPSTVNGRRRS